MVQKINELPLTQIDGSSAQLSDFAGSVLLIVNVASKCGLTPQYTALQAIYDKYKSQGFEILAFPSNEFAAQEPGTDAEISDFCSLNYGVTFPLFSKICVNGELRHPQAIAKADGTLRSRLADRQLLPTNETDIMWNFEKFLIGRDGHVIGRYAPDITPDSPELIAAIELALQ